MSFYVNYIVFSEEMGECSGLGVTHGLDGHPIKRKRDENSEFEGKTGATKRQFKSPEDEDKIYELSNKKFSEQSKRKIKWALKMYDEWRVSRMKELYVASQIRRSDLKFKDFSQEDLSYSLCRFITEVRKLDNSDFPPNTLREIVIMIQMYLNEKGVYWKLLDGEKFCELRNTVDNLMKSRHAKGLGVKHSSEVISMVHEDRLFQSKVLGDENPMQLLRTVMYLLGLHLALRGRCRTY